MTWRSILAACCLVLASGCGDDSTGDNQNNNNTACPDGYERRGPACAPIFDDCPGPAEIPVLGGGCRPVGVTQCATGFVSDSEGGCDPILPDSPCPAGTMEVIGQTDCRPVGVTACADGFVSDGQGGCDPVLPQDPCPLGTIEILGETACQPLGDCGTGTWGNITTDATTVFVNATADATGADGSDASPFTTIGEALAVVQPGGQIAVAAGEYVERLQINQRVELAGRCAELVTIRGVFFAGQNRPPVVINSGGTSTTIRGVTLTGDAEGLVVSGAQAVLVEEVQVLLTGSYGISIRDHGEASVRRTLVAECTAVGIRSFGSTLEVVESVVRDTEVRSRDGLFGRGISAECSWDHVCGLLNVSRSLIHGNKEAGINLYGGVAIVVDSVVRDTQVRDADSLWGRGILAQCDPSVNLCGSLTVAGSVITGNTEVGISIHGADVSISSTVVKDTAPTSVNGNGGRGIISECRPQTGFCGSLTVNDSLIDGNTEAGIAVLGVDTAITSTLVRNTQARQAGGIYGSGINAQCDDRVSMCGTLDVTDCLVTGNTSAGINVAGMDATVESTVVRGTRARPGDGKFGRGIGATCHPMMEACGSLNVNGSLVVGNMEMGIVAMGVTADIIATVVRDTQARPSDETGGFGIMALCDPRGFCGGLNVSGSLVQGNTTAGVLFTDVEVAIASTVVRDTRARPSDGDIGRGINGQCSPGAADCGSLSLIDSLVAGNRDGGVFVVGVDAEVVSTIVRNTLPCEKDQLFGRGITSQCHEEAGVCGSLAVSDSLVAANRDLGIFTAGVDAAVQTTVVRDTLPQEAEGTVGRGIAAVCFRGVGACGSLSVVESLILRNRNIGVSSHGVPMVLLGVKVEDTRPNEQGPWQDDFGGGIFAACDSRMSRCGTLAMANCVVESSYTAGLGIQGVPGSIESSVISHVGPRPLDDGFGYGIQVEGLQGLSPLVFDIRSCLIEDASLAGVLYARGAGNLSRSVILGGHYSVVANPGSAPEVADDNDLAGTERDGLYWGNMDPSPAPAPSLPAEID